MHVAPTHLFNLSVTIGLRHSLAIWVAATVVVAGLSPAWGEDGPAPPDKRQAELARLLRILPKSARWEKWLQESGELPPDFDTLPSIPGLPDPLLEEGDRKGVVRDR